jgi:hypothetical protein
LTLLLDLLHTFCGLLLSEEHRSVRLEMVLQTFYGAR